MYFYFVYLGAIKLCPAVYGPPRFRMQVEYPKPDSVAEEEEE